jgi:hypothetical protein
MSPLDAASDLAPPPTYSQLTHPIVLTCDGNGLFVRTHSLIPSNSTPSSANKAIKSQKLQAFEGHWLC